MRILSGFDLGVIAEWTGSLLPPPFTGGEWPGRGADFADVNGDGARDLLMGTAEAFLGGTGFVGRVDVIPSGATLPLYAVWGTGATDLLGQRVVAIGDTSGNGVPDFVAFSYGANSPMGVGTGAIVLIEGADGVIRSTIFATGAGPLGVFNFNALGDLDGDGLADLAIAYPDANMSTGIVDIHSGFDTTIVIRQHVGTVPGWLYGSGSILSIGDADADATADYVIGAHTWGSGTASAPGAAWLYSGATGAVIQTYQGPPGTAWLGRSGDRLDDVDGDGVDDVVLGAPQSTPAPGNIAPGRVLVFSSLSGALLQEVHPPTPGLGPGQAFGVQVKNVEDIDGDGHWDFVVGQSATLAFRVYTRDIVSLSANPVPIGSTAVFQFGLPAQPGAVFHICLAGTATTGIPVGTRTFPLDPDAILLATLENPLLGGALDANGVGTASIPVPADPSLSGVSLKYAGFTLSPASPFGVRTIGTAKTVTLQ